jgi:hypothetical protein
MSWARIRKGAGPTRIPHLRPLAAPPPRRPRPRRSRNRTQHIPSGPQQPAGPASASVRALLRVCLPHPAGGAPPSSCLAALQPPTSRQRPRGVRAVLTASSSVGTQKTGPLPRAARGGGA